MRERGTQGILDYYRLARAGGSDYVGYSEPTLKRAVLRAVLPLPAQRVVELGCGPNPVVPFALAHAGRQVTVVDISPDFVETALVNARRRGVGVEAVCAAAHESGLRVGAYDLAILTEVLEHVPDELEEPTVAEAHRLLRPGGWFVISVPNEHGLFPRYQRLRAGLAENEEHLREYTPASLRTLLERVGFEIERALRVPATLERPWRTKSAWLIDRATLRPEWSIKIAFLARRR